MLHLTARSHTGARRQTAPPLGATLSSVSVPILPPIWPDVMGDFEMQKAKRLGELA